MSLGQESLPATLRRNGRAAPARADFLPLPLLSNPHVQTLLSQCLRGMPFWHPTREHHVALPDGDRFALHDSVPPGWRPGDRVALLLHGLGGCARSPHIRRMTRRLLRVGLRVVRMDLRGAGRGLALARRAYHAGCSTDVRAAVAAIQRWAPGSSLVLIGLSLGGNIALKLAGEATVEPVPGLERVVAIGPPIDLGRCAALIARPQNWIYELYFVRMLLQQYHARRRLVPGLPAVQFPRRVTLRTFDELVTAPNWGFADAAEYYRRASALPLIERIAVPTLILTARDDPFIAAEPFAEFSPPPGVEVHVARHGGHLGFLGWDGAGGIRWGERRVVEWVLRP